jgi:nucleobase:cation symporter-1, NCS1 family
MFDIITGIMVSVPQYRTSPSGAVDMVTMRRKLLPGSGSGSSGSALPLELNGTNVIQAAERKGHPRTLFWPWFAANVSVLGLSYGAFLLGFGIGFWQAVVAGLIGIVLSFLLVGFV